MRLLNSRRQALIALAGASAGLWLPAWAGPKTPAMTEGPFYPRPRDLPLDQDNDLSTIAGKSGVATGILLDFTGRVVDERERPLKNALVEIWQCNAHGRYHHGDDNSSAPRDPFFQGFGKTITDGDGRYRFRTIKPVGYSGRTPHIHFKLKSREFGEMTSQIFIEGDPGNERDGVLRSIRNAADRQRLMMALTPRVENGSDLKGFFDMVVG